MIKLLCTATPIGNIRTRQPKSPGVGNKNHPSPQARPPEVWGNPTRAVKGSPTDYRCTNCAHTGHQKVSG